MMIDDSGACATEDSLPNADSRNPQSTQTFAEDCGCLMAIDEAEREGDYWGLIAMTTLAKGFETKHFCRMALR